MQTGLDPSALERDGFPALGREIGGTSMAGLLAAGGMASALGLFVANLLSVSRLPKAMSDDGCLPSVLRKVDRRRGTPYVSIIGCAAVVSGMVLWQFEDLLIIDVILYGCALFLEFLALISLRRRQPAMERPFRIPLSPGGLVAMTCLPALCFLAGIAALAANESIHTNALVFALGSVCTAPLAWLAARKGEPVRAPG